MVLMPYWFYKGSLMGRKQADREVHGQMTLYSLHYRPIIAYLTSYHITDLQWHWQNHIKVETDKPKLKVDAEVKVKRLAEDRNTSDIYGGT